jgi:hypothetical protein
MSLTRCSAIAASALLLGTLTTAPAVATPTAAGAATAACTMTVGSITAGGDIGYSNITAGSPITARQGTAVHLFTPGVAKTSATWTHSPRSTGGDITSGTVLLNTTLYSSWYGTDPDGKPTSGMNGVGRNHGGYRMIEYTSPWTGGGAAASYRLRGDGVLYRWIYNLDDPYGSAVITPLSGFSAVKSMALISETKTYDTFLANTRSGGLYTVHIPRTGMPVVTKVRTSTWQTFEHLVAERCGTQSTLLTAIDKETGNAYLYAVGHDATVIKGLGKIPGTYKDPIYYLRTTSTVPPLYGE